MTTWTEDELDRSGRANELHIASGGVDRDVVFADGGRLDRAAIDAAYREKFGVNTYSDGVTTDASAAATLVVEPA
ncbi:hypothetical protein [Microbacterium indicum]|uniref:hypothetical protein n=1 Tax=Microbacterium indicum TaxID=358100 RepID=UPI0004196AEE|nr:hypothetical protein [Microbacterium indicum]